MLSLTKNAVMIGLGCLFIYLAVKKKYEPLLLLPIGFGAIIVNLPGSGLMEPGGILRVLYDYGIITELFPVLLFVGIGAMTDFGPLLQRPRLIFLAAAGQLGIFVSMMLALCVGFDLLEASSIGIIGAMDGPSAIFVTSSFAPHLLGSVAICAYSYMALVPVIQHPIMMILTTKRERGIKMRYEPDRYPKAVKILFPVIVTIVTGVLAPEATPLMGSLMLGNLLKESGVVERLSNTAQNELNNIVTLLLGITIGGTMVAESFLTYSTLLIFGLGLLAFSSAIASGLILGKLIAFFTKQRINPLIGAAGVSAYPMAARAVHLAGRREDPDNFLLMQAMAVNTGGQIASVIAAGAILKLVPIFLGF